MIEYILNWIEKSRLFIGLGLIISIMIGGVYWLYPTQSTSVKANDSQKVAELEKTIKQLTDRVNDLSKDNSISQAQVNPPVSEPQANLSSVSSTNVTSKININTASVSQLDTLPGIGATYAQRIIDYRTTKGGFKSLSELENIKGIGDKTFAKLKDRITID